MHLHLIFANYILNIERVLEGYRFALVWKLCMYWRILLIFLLCLGPDEVNMEIVPQLHLEEENLNDKSDVTDFSDDSAKDCEHLILNIWG